MKKRKNRIPKWLLWTFVMISIGALGMSSYTLAKYTGNTKVADEVTLEYFDVAINTAYPMQNGVITLTLQEYENFKLSLKYEGEGKSHVRVLVQESWVAIDGSGLETVVFASGSSDYDVDSGIHDNRAVDGYLYVKNPTNEEINAGEISVIEGVNQPLPATSPIPATHVKLIIRIDAVQYNRYQAFWGTLPY